jgi:hypothetical protein
MWSSGKPVAKENLSQWILLCDGPQDAELSLKLAHDLCHSQLMLLQQFLRYMDMPQPG